MCNVWLAQETTTERFEKHHSFQWQWPSTHLILLFVISRINIETLGCPSSSPNQTALINLKVISSAHHERTWVSFKELIYASVCFVSWSYIYSPPGATDTVQRKTAIDVYLF